MLNDGGILLYAGHVEYLVQDLQCGLDFFCDADGAGCQLDGVEGKEEGVGYFAVVYGAEGAELLLRQVPGVVGQLFL